MTSPQWRVRESCCAGLTDLLRGRTLESCNHILPDLWTDVFRVMDDIKVGWMYVFRKYRFVFFLFVLLHYINDLGRLFKLSFVWKLLRFPRICNFYL